MINPQGPVVLAKILSVARYQSDVTVMDLASKTFKDITDFDGMDSWPMWGQDGSVYFVSDRDGKGLTNLWRVAENGGKAEKVTQFQSGDVRFPGMSGDRKTIVFEHDFGIWKLDLASKESKPIHLDIAAETQEDLFEFREFSSTADDFDVAPNGRRIAIAVHGEIFTVPTDEGELRQLTESPARDQEVLYSPDGRWIAYLSDPNGREEIYIVSADGSGSATKVTDVDALKSSMIWSPDSKSLAFTTSGGKLYTITAEGKDLKEIASSKYGDISRPAWSPDGSLIAYSRADVTRSRDIYLIPAKGGEEKKVTFDSSNESNPQFSADSKKLYFVRMDGEPGQGGNERPASRLYCMPLEKLDKDPEEAETRADAADGAEGGPAGGAGAPGEGRRPERHPAPGSRDRRRGALTKATEPKIDWAGLKRRTRQVTTMTVMNYVPGNDGRTLIFVATEGGGGGGGGGQAGRRRPAAGRRGTPLVDLFDPGRWQADDPDHDGNRRTGHRRSEYAAAPRSRRLRRPRRHQRAAAHAGRTHALLPRGRRRL